jgi:hypothetical protein
MDIARALLDRVNTSMRLTNSLAESVDDTTLRSHLPDGVRSNTVGEQFWCINGARESYARALKMGKWSGFTNTLASEAVQSAVLVREALSKSQSLVLQTWQELDDRVGEFDRASLMIRLVEHEASHHGQLIRFWYALGIAFPREFALRYSLDS